jgi:hypothetical protein
MNLNTFGGRRFLLTVLSGIGTWVLCWSAKIGGETYSLVTIATVAAYIGGNVAQRKIESAAPPG